MANLKAIKDRTRDVKADLGDGDTLTVTYRPAAYTPAFEERGQAAIDAGDRAALSKMLVELVIDWDLYFDEANKRKVPLDVATLQDVPMLVLSSVIDAVGSDLRPNRTSAVASAGGSME